MEPNGIATALLLLACIGISALVVQALVLVRHMRTRPPAPTRFPGVSLLKPLCGVDDDLWHNIESFADLDYLDYEVLLGVRNVEDRAYPLACEAAQRWPDRMRVVVQWGEPGRNPKVNQLITLAARAKHEILIINDSNVAVQPDYLNEVVAHFEDREVGLVAHPIAGTGERSLGALFDNTHLAGAMTLGMVAATRVADFPIVIGKSMALRRTDLRALGGFHSVKDVLAEDFVLGQRVSQELGKRVVVAHSPILSISRDRTLRGFIDRYSRWGIIQHQSVGTLRYMGVALLNPVPLTAAAVALHPSRATWLACLACLLIRALVEQTAALSLRGRALPARAFFAMPLKDALLLWTWLTGLLRNHVTWRGNRLVVLDGTRLASASPRRRTRAIGWLRLRAQRRFR